MMRVHTKSTFASKLSLLVMLLLVVASNGWCFDAEVTQFNEAQEIDFSANNINFLSVDPDNKAINIWRRDTKAIVSVYYTTSTPNSAKYSKDGTYIGIGMQNGNILILTAATMTPFGSVISNPVGAIVEIDFSWNSNSFIACSSSQIKFLSLAGVSSWTISESNIESCKLNKADGVGYSFNNNQLQWLAYGTNTKVASKRYNCGGGGCSDDYFQVDFSTDNGSFTRLVAGNKDNKFYYIKAGDSGNGAGTQILSASDQGNTVCYSKDNNYIAAGDKNGRLYILNATNRADVLFSKFTDSGSDLEHCRFSYDTQYLAVSSDTGAIYFYTSNCFVNKCAQGAYEDSNGVCRSCSSISKCLVCSSATVCNYCIQGFYLNGLTCSSCSLVGCNACENSTKCTQCQQGYFLDYSTNTCSQCQGNITGCLSCQRNSTNSTVFCRQCNSEFYLNSTDSLCYPCFSNNLRCLRCNSSSSCLHCQMGYYLDTNFACQVCASNCLMCASSSVCITCVKGYYPNSSNLCTACSSNCLSCYSTGLCISCNMGTFLNAGICTPCASPCSTCNSTSTSCLSCSYGFYYAGTGSCVSCSSNCLVCNSSSQCTSCEAGYYLNSSNLCSMCYNAYSNCSTCITNACLSCQSGFFLNSSNNCQSCSAISNCYVCLTSTACSQCNIGFYLSGGNCLSCPSQCESCTNSTFCVNCMIGYYFNSNSCTACISPCITCTSATNCVSCQNGFYLDTSASPNVCSKCLLSIIGCVSCNSSSYCNQCQLGRYILGTGTCSMCPSNCSTCNASSLCLSCSVGYYLSGAFCVKCNQNCSQCSSSTACSSCNVGYYLNTSLSVNNCVACLTVGCQTCNINGCISCQIGYYISSLSCLACNSTYSNCLTCSESACVKCLVGFYSNSGVCTLCYNTLNGCITCYNNTVCSECGVSYYLASNLTCAFCPIQCKTCENNICTSCQGRYIFNAAQTDCLLCESFIKGCQICSANNTCSTCYEGFYLSSNSCQYCKATLLGCISCSNSSFCTVCQDEYYLVNGVCTTCQSIQSCLYCTNSTACLSCATGYYLNTNNTCSLCTVSLPGCIFCSSPSTCKQCQTGYFLNTTSNQCQLCANTIGGCLSCLNSSKCISCDGGYYLSTTTFACISCNVTGCQVCGDNSSSVCLSCSLGYYLSGTSCTSCPISGCLQCVNSSSCLRCDAGYYLSASSSCVKCQSTMTGCSKCINSTVCTQCDTSFFINSTFQCSQCSLDLPFCEVCFNGSFCSICRSGYYSQSGSCLSCSTMPGCFMCLSSTVCQNCLKGYFLSGNQCVQCSSVLGNCFDCVNSSVCLSCQSGYILDASSNCNAVSVSGAVEPQPIPYLRVKTYYVNSQTLKHVFSTKQGYTFTKQTLGWSSVTTIALYNSASSTTIYLTITSVDWGKGSTSIIFYTNNPLNINSDTFSMSFTRLLVTQNDFSLSYQTKFKMTQAALELLLPDQIIPNDFSQDQPLMEPSFYMSYIQNSGEYYFSIIGYVIAIALFINFFIKATCTASDSKNMGSIIPHIFSLKTCVLMVFPIYPQIANFCFGLMSADIPWFTEYYASYLTLPNDIQPAGFQLFYVNMNFASLYLSALILFLLLLLLGYLSFSKSQRGEQKVFSLEEDDPSDLSNKNESSYSYLRMIYLYFTFGLTFAGAASIQGSLYNQGKSFSINGLFYMFGGIIYCIQLAVTIKLTMRQKRSCYVRSFIKASILAVAHISPVYICTLAFIIDQLIVCIQFVKNRQVFMFPKLWMTKNTLANLCLLFLYYFNEKKIALFSVIAFLFVIILIEFIEHVSQTGEQTVSKRVNPTKKNNFKHNEISLESNQETINYFISDLKISNQKQQIAEPNTFNQSKTTFKSSNAFTEELTNTKIFQTKTGRSQKRYRPFKKGAAKRQSTRMNPIIERDENIFEQ